jgi:hypothetical protein
MSDMDEKRQAFLREFLAYLQTAPLDDALSEIMGTMVALIGLLQLVQPEQ